MGFIQDLAEFRFLRQRVAELEQDNTELKFDLRREIDANRQREDALRQAFVERELKKPLQLRARPLLARRQAEPDEVETVIDLTDPEETPGDLVTRRAREFYEQALANGHHYDFDELVAAIKANPHEYLEN